MSSSLSIRMNDEKLLALDAGRTTPGDVKGHVIPVLYERLVKAVAEHDGAHEDDSRVVIADRQIPYDTIVDVLYSWLTVGHTARCCAPMSAPRASRPSTPRKMSRITPRNGCDPLRRASTPSTRRRSAAQV